MSSGLFAQLDLGKRSLMAQQAGMGVAGHNIANVNNEDFSRQKVALEAQHPNRTQFGAGVDVQGVGRVADRFLNQRLIAEQSRSGALEVRSDGLRRMEGLFAEVEGFGLRGALNEFWGAWGRLANSPETEIYRQDLVQTSTNLADRVSGLHRDFQNLRKELNGTISERVNALNEMAKQLSEVNTAIQRSTRGAKGDTNDLEDRREKIIKDMSTIVQLDWFVSDDGMANVNIGNGWPLVNGRRVNPVEASFDNDEVGMFSLKGVDPKGLERDLTGYLRSGQLVESVNLRDGIVKGFMDKLDELAAELAWQVNSAHATGTGLNVTHEKLDSSYALKEDAWNQPLPFIKDGLFRIRLVDDEGNDLETYEVELQAGRDTLRDVVQRINEAVGDPTIFQAKLNTEGSVTLQSTGPYNFVLGDDETGFAVTMGFNNFFESLSGAQDFHLNARLKQRPQEISAGRNLLPGDNSVALAVTELQFKPTMEGESITFDEFYNGMMAELGLRINRAQEDQRNHEVVVNQFQKMRDEVSSVNMDEEVADLVQYQRGFDAAAKFITAVDEMTQTVVRM